MSYPNIPNIPSIPTPPPREEQTEYFLILSEWIDIVDQPVLATPSNPNPAPGRVAIPRRSNELICMHPIEYAMQQQAVRQSYVISMVERITAERYNATMKVLREAAEQQTSVNSNGSKLIH